MHNSLGDKLMWALCIAAPFVVAAACIYKRFFN